MTHFITFICSAIAIITYTATALTYWMRRGTNDREEAVFLTFCTLIGTVIVIILIYTLWIVTK